MKQFLAAGYYPDNQQRFSTVIDANAAEDAELQFFVKTAENCGYANGALVALFELPADFYPVDVSAGADVNFGPDRFEQCVECNHVFVDDEQRVDVRFYGSIDQLCLTCADAARLAELQS